MLLRRLTLRTRFLLIMAIVTLGPCIPRRLGCDCQPGGHEPRVRALRRRQGGAEGIAKLRESLFKMRQLQASIIAVGSNNTNEVERLTGLWKAETGHAAQLADALAQGDPDNAELAALLKAQKDHLKAYVAAIAPIAEQLQQARIDGAAALAYAEQAEETVTALMTGADAILKATQARQAAIRDGMAASSTFVSNLRLLLVAVTLAIVLPLLWLTLQSVCGPLERGGGGGWPHRAGRSRRAHRHRGPRRNRGADALAARHAGGAAHAGGPGA